MKVIVITDKESWNKFKNFLILNGINNSRIPEGSAGQVNEGITK